jgi:ribosomal protein S18 acetylase RimI-like enzyme
VPDVSRRAATALRAVVLGAAELSVAEPRAVRLRPVEPSTIRAGAVTSRPATPADEPFLRRVFRDVRDGEPGAGPDPSLGLKYRAHSADRRDRYPDAETSIVLEDGEPVGTLTLQHEDGRTHLVDLAIVAERQGLGIGSTVLSGLLATHHRLTVTVWEHNHRAQRLYERHGFAVVAEQFGYLLMATEADR